MRIFISIYDHKRLNSLLVLCYYLITSYTPLFSQTQPIEYQKVDIISGLSQNTVLSAFQDKIGFLWFGTTDGLNRFDGQNFTNFLCDVENSKTISNNVIKVICEDKNNNLYIGTEDGLNIYIRSSQKFERIFRDTLQTVTLPSNNINGIALDNNDKLWVGTNKGLVVLDINSKVFLKFKDFVKDDMGLDSIKILDVIIDSKQNLWIGTYSHGFYKFDAKKKELKQFIIHDEKAYSYLNNTIFKIYEDNYSSIWFATNNGIAKFDMSTEKISRYIYSRSPSTLENSIYFQSLIQTSDGVLYAGSGDFGMYQYDYKKDAFTPISIRKNESGILSGNSYLCMLEDKSGVLWLGTSNDGLLKINLHKKAFHWIANIENDDNSILHNNISALAEVGDQNVWIGTHKGISIWDRKKNIFNHILPDRNSGNSIKSNGVLMFYEDSKGNIWIGTTDGVDVYYKKEKTFKHYFTDYVSENQLPDNQVYDIKEDAEGRIWMATLFGLSRFDPEKNSFKNYFYSDKDTNSIPSNTVWYLHIDSKKNIWIATANGLAKYLPKTDNFKRFNFGNPSKGSKAQQEIYSIEEDEDGILWCSTSMHGFVRFDPSSAQIKQYPTIKKFGTNTVYSIRPYKDFIWFASVKALGRFNKKTGEIIKFDNKDGIKSNEFNAPSILTHDSLLVFGGINGITFFKPEEINVDTFKPPLVFTSLKINFVEILPGENYKESIPLDSNINSAESIKLNYDDNVFSISISSLDYKIKEKIEYAYMLEGVNKEWIELGNENTIKFTGLRHGKYKLLVKATNSDGIWNEEPISLTIIINPPWWKTNLFIGLASFLFLLLSFFIIKSREKRLRLTKQRLEENVKSRTLEIEMQKEEIESQKDLIEKQNEKLKHHTLHLEEEVEKRLVDLIIARDKAEESDRLKSAFLSNMSHEIRTPLNAIIGFSELLGDHDISKEDQLRFLDIIKNNSNDLLNLFNKLIDIAVIQSKQLSLSKTLFNLNTLLDEVFRNYYTKLHINSSKVHLVLHKDIDEQEFKVYTDPIRLKQILSYLINNAIKYTETGFINFGYYQRDGELEFFVKDTGIGIPENKLPNLFNRFEKLERAKDKLYRGTGLGLSISKDLIELMGGKIFVESKLAEGTVFYFTIPLHNNHGTE